LKQTRLFVREGTGLVKVMGIELDYIFRGKRAKSFLQLIAYNKNLNLYKMKVIRNIVNFLWMYFKTPMFIFMFIPFVVYFSVYIVYATYSIQYKDTPPTLLNPILRWISLFLLLYNLLFLTLGRIWTLGWKFIKSVWIWFDIISSGLNLFVISIDVLDWNVRVINAVNCFAVLLMWFKFFYFMRMFWKTTTLVWLVI